MRDDSTLFQGLNGKKKLSLFFYYTIHVIGKWKWAHQHIENCILNCLFFNSLFYSSIFNIYWYFTYSRTNNYFSFGSPFSYPIEMNINASFLVLLGQILYIVVLFIICIGWMRKRAKFIMALWVGVLVSIHYNGKWKYIYFFDQLSIIGSKVGRVIHTDSNFLFVCLFSERFNFVFPVISI